MLFGVDPIIGLLLFTSGGGITIALLGRRAAARDVQIGTVLAFLLGLGVLFISLYSGYATEASSILFGEILGISSDDVLSDAYCQPDNSSLDRGRIPATLFASLDEDVGSGGKRAAYAFARCHFYAAGRRCDIDIGSGCRCPAYFCIDGDSERQSPNG